MRRIADVIDAVNYAIGTVLAWVALALVLVQFAIVLMRYVFGVSHIFVQESVVYMHAVLFMVAVGYTLLQNGHVRVDIFYGAASPKRKALIDFIGVWLFIAPMVLVTWQLAWPYVAFAWRIRESSPEGSGIPAVFLLKTTILVFVVLLALQGIALAIRSLLVMAGVERKATVEQRIDL